MLDFSSQQAFGECSADCQGTIWEHARLSLSPKLTIVLPLQGLALAVPSAQNAVPPDGTFHSLLEVPYQGTSGSCLLLLLVHPPTFPLLSPPLLCPDLALKLLTLSVY